MSGVAIEKKVFPEAILFGFGGGPPGDAGGGERGQEEKDNQDLGNWTRRGVGHNR